jgi:hypothetical protein
MNGLSAAFRFPGSKVAGSDLAGRGRALGRGTRRAGSSSGRSLGGCALACSRRVEVDAWARGALLGGVGSALARALRAGWARMELLARGRGVGRSRLLGRARWRRAGPWAR